MKRWSRALLIAASCVAGGALCCALGLAGLRAASDAYYTDKMKRATTPLEPEVVQDLCQKVVVPEGCWLCKPGAEVYAPDFFGAVYDTFKPGLMTYDDVQEKIGRYQYKHEAPVYYPDEGLRFFRCLYDFRGDEAYPISMSFTEDGWLERVVASTGSS